MKQLIFILCLVSTQFIYSSDKLRPLEFTGHEFTTNESIELNKYKGKIVYMDFWASWCPPCLESLPFLESLHKNLPEEEFKIIAINIDEEKNQAESFLKDHPISYLNLYDPEGSIGKKLRVQNMPTAFLIDRDGNVLFKHSGFNQKYAEKLEQTLITLVNK